MIGFSLICYFAVQAGLLLETLLDILALQKRSLVDGSLPLSLFNEVVGIGKEFARHSFLHLLKLVTILLEESWHIYIILFRWCNQNMVFHAKVKPDAFTQSGNDGILLYFTGKKDIDVADTVSFDHDSLYDALDFAGLMVAVLLLVDDDGMSILIQLPASLFQCERLAFVKLSELRRPLVLFVEEFLVSKMDTIRYILDSLGAILFQVAEFRPFAYFR